MNFMQSPFFYILLLMSFFSVSRYILRIADIFLSGNPYNFIYQQTII